MSSTAMLKPRAIEVESIGPNAATVTMEPFERGYGHTLGNALRRILLSSMPGFAATEVKMNGVLHEYSTIDGVQEDVVDILLNLKGIVLKLHNREEAELTLRKQGEGVVTAGDIQADANIQIINPDQVICTLDHKRSFEAEIEIKTGRGYWPGETNKKEEQAIGVIPVDSLFSPVRLVKYTVEATRVGQITDYDKLILEVWTDGTMDGQVAVSMAAEILRQQFERRAVGTGDDARTVDAQHPGRHAGQDRVGQPATGVEFLVVARQVGIRLRTAVDLALLVIEDAAAQRAVGAVLLGAVERQIDIQAP